MEGGREGGRENTMRRKYESTTKHTVVVQFSLSTSAHTP